MMNDSKLQEKPSRSWKNIYKRRNTREKRTSVNVLVDEYLQSLKDRNYSGATIRTFDNMLNRFCNFLIKQNIERMQEVTASDINKYAIETIEKNFAGTTTHHYLRTVKKFFDWLAETQRIFVNPTADFSVRKPPRRLQPVPTEEDVKKLLRFIDVNDGVGLRDRAIIELFWSTGLRLEEMTSLNVSDPNLKLGRLRVLGKGNKERMVPVGKQARYWMERYMTKHRSRWKKNVGERALWLGRKNGCRLACQIIQKNLIKYCENAGIKTPITPHSLRRACATHLLRRGAHPVEIQMLLGHSRLDALSQYLQVTVKDMLKTHKASKVGR